MSQNSPVKPITSVYFHTLTHISRPRRPHISNVHLWIDNAREFSAWTVNPGACTGAHSDIRSPLAHGCQGCERSTVWDGVFSEASAGSYKFSALFFSFYAYWQGIIVEITEMCQGVFILLMCNVL